MAIIKKPTPIERTIEVAEVGSLGLKTKEGDWLAADAGSAYPLSSFTVGGIYSIVVSPGVGGKGYITSVTSSTLPTSAPFILDEPTTDVKPIPCPTVALAAKKPEIKSQKDPDAMSKADWAAKDMRINRCGIIKSVLESQFLANEALSLKSTEEKIGLAIEVASRLELWVNGQQGGTK